VIGEAPALLADFIGTHVLVAKSGRRGRNSRKRWFAGVSLHASSEPSSALIEIAASEVEITASRAGGPGGQHVNTTDSAVRVRHKGSGVTVRVASELPSELPASDHSIKIAAAHSRACGPS
jgi:peptide chain release factor 2/peptide chain release factor